MEGSRSQAQIQTGTIPSSHLKRARNPEDIAVLGDQATIVIRDFLIEHEELFEEETKQVKKHKAHSHSKSIQELQLMKGKKHLAEKVLKRKRNSFTNVLQQ